MIRFSQYLVESEEITRNDLAKLETYLDAMYKQIGVDFEFTRHFLDRCNDARNGKQITVGELQDLFRKEFQIHGKRITQMGTGAEGVMKDMRTDLNCPFALNWHRNSGMIELVTKTVMRKKNFTTPSPVFKVG